MKDLIEHNALPFPKDHLFSNRSEDPQQVCHSLKIHIFAFIADIERLLKTPLLADHLEFLDHIAAHIVTLHSLTASAHICSPELQETSLLIDNMLRCTVLLKGQGFSLSTLDAAKIYRRNRKNKDPISTMLKAYIENRSTTESLLTELKLLAIDLKEGREHS